MPDNTNPAAKPESAATSDEFDFDLPVTESPRLKRRSLKPRTTAPLAPASGAPPAARDLEREAPPVSAETARPEHQPSPEKDADAEINAAVKFTEPAPKTSPSAAKPTPATTGYTPRTMPVTQPASPHGTRPATLYYSSATPRKDKEEPEPAPMKTTPTASPNPSSTTTSSPARSAAAPTTRPATVVDYRTNVERQSREQKSIGSVLSIIVYILIALFVLGASSAAYGIYALSKQLHQQSLTIDELDKHYAAQHEALATQLNTTIETLTKAQAQIGREQELILQQQESINKLISANDATVTALRQEKQARASETASLRARLNNVENRVQPR